MCTLLSVVRLSLGEIGGKDSSTVVCRLLHRTARRVCAHANGAGGSAATAAAATDGAAAADGGSDSRAGSVCRGAAVAGCAPAQEVVQVQSGSASSSPPHEAYALVRRRRGIASFGRAQPFGCARLCSPSFRVGRDSGTGVG
jgi:hypothetical protein